MGEILNETRRCSSRVRNLPGQGCVIALRPVSKGCYIEPIGVFELIDEANVKATL